MRLGVGGGKFGVRGGLNFGRGGVRGGIGLGPFSLGGGGGCLDSIIGLLVAGAILLAIILAITFGAMAIVVIVAGLIGLLPGILLGLFRLTNLYSRIGRATRAVIAAPIFLGLVVAGGALIARIWFVISRWNVVTNWDPVVFNWPEDPEDFYIDTLGFPFISWGVGIGISVCVAISRYLGRLNQRSLEKKASRKRST